MIKRYFSALGGAAVLAVNVYFSFNVAMGMYYSYIVWPRQKVEEHYIMPRRWQDLTFLIVFWATSFVLLFVSFLLIRSAFKGRRVPK